ncbi:MAG: lauroyl/myristoyl acyltransferase [Candidatus Krumholzibacteriia bacterium]|jgi:lauroyl/myristoyl acyltransferase
MVRDSRTYESRPSRSGPSRSSGPDGQQNENDNLEQANLVWDLWNLRALFPDAERDDLLRVLRRRISGLAREREALVGLWAGDQVILTPGRNFLRAAPELNHGIVVSLHLGPYQLLAEPWLAAGHDPVVLINAGALAEFELASEGMSSHLRHRGKLTFLPVGSPGSLKKAVQGVRDGRPVIVYLDGNNGDQGMGRTREQGLRYQLPGRQIRVRTGLARLACRLEAPLHMINLRWEAGEVMWERAPTLRPRREGDVSAITRRLFDWLFSQVIKFPDQWHYWAMIKDSSSCFTKSRLDERKIPTGLRNDFQKAFLACLEHSPNRVHLILEKDVEVWSGDVLADLTEDRFYPAANMRDQDLDALRASRQSLAELSKSNGLPWVRFHGLRLCLLGMARLGGISDDS